MTNTAIPGRARANDIVAYPIHLEQNLTLRPIDRFEHCGKRFPTIAQMAKTVIAHLVQACSFDVRQHKQKLAS